MRAPVSSVFRQRLLVKVLTDTVDASTLARSPPWADQQNMRMVLRAATAVDHEAVDEAFSRFDLSSRPSYIRFLRAHAWALAPLEKAVAGFAASPRARYPLLKADLEELGVADSAEADTLPVQAEAASWGIVYVLEGSRIGGGILAKRVSAGLPTRYLSAVHEAGSWRRFADALELAGGSQGIDWSNAAISGAKSAFARFAEAAASA